MKFMKLCSDSSREEIAYFYDDESRLPEINTKLETLSRKDIVATNALLVYASFVELQCDPKQMVLLMRNLLQFSKIPW